jgi:hypothetical protein
MDYELAKELRDAGFPQKSPTISEPKEYTPDGAYMAALEELIEACRKPAHFVSVDEVFEGWEAYLQDHDYEFRFTKGKGSTPTEAVARLYIALNLKKA